MYDYLLLKNEQLICQKCPLAKKKKKWCALCAPALKMILYCCVKSEVYSVYCVMTESCGYDPVFNLVLEVNERSVGIVRSGLITVKLKKV